MQCRAKVSTTSNNTRKATCNIGRRYENDGSTKLSVCTLQELGRNEVLLPITDKFFSEFIKLLFKEKLKTSPS